VHAPRVRLRRGRRVFCTRLRVTPLTSWTVRERSKPLGKLAACYAILGACGTRNIVFRRMNQWRSTGTRTVGTCLDRGFTTNPRSRQALLLGRAMENEGRRLAERRSLGLVM